jgi:C_GCAxxG_C_C family probable redox protein
VGEALFGEVDDVVRRASTPLGGGYGRSLQELCGILPGAAIVIGLLYGRTDSEESGLPAYAVAARFRERFLETFGYVRCPELRELAGYGTDEKPCPNLVADAAMLLLDVLREAPQIIAEASEE